MEHEKALKLFGGLSEREQIAVLKKLIRKRIEDSECWAKQDMKTLLRLFKILRRKP